MTRKLLFYLGFVILLLDVSAEKVSINSITVPKLFTLSKEENNTIRMDCDFTVEITDASKKGFVLKWLHDNVPIYQYIPSRNRPFALGSFVNRTDLTQVVDDDIYKRYSSLIITHPAVTDSGNYSCSVETYTSKELKTAKIQIVDPEDSINLEYEFNANDTVLFTCKVSKIYPEPVIKFLFNDEEKDFPIETEKNVEEGTYTISTTVQKDAIKDESPVACVLTIPESDYSKTETKTYDDPKVSSTKPSGEKTNLFQSGDDAVNAAGFTRSSIEILMIAVLISLFRV